MVLYWVFTMQQETIKQFSPPWFSQTTNMGILRVVTSLIRLLIVEKQVLLGTPTVKIKFFQIHDQSLWKTGCEWVYKISSVICLLEEFHGKDRSEEHTSELQSPVPISYAVFCLKKKKQNYNYALNF